MALAAGINLLLSPLISVNLAKSGLLAPDGRCRSFDAKASGYVRSEGAAVIALKPLSAASRDGDRIYALIAGTAVNQDGRSNGLTAPNRQAQEDVLLKAYADAQIAPGRVRYVEAHGTGTPLGDPIEVRALSNVMNVDRPAGRACALGSVKTNLGHTEAAAGVTALVKVALCLHHRRLPKTLHYREANPHIGFSDTPLRVQETLGPWPAGDGPLVAGVSSFGFGGTNAHAVLLEAEPGQSAPASLPSGLAVLPLSARSRPALHELAGKFRTFLLEHPDADLGNIYYSAGVRRDHHDFRLAIASDTRIQLIRNIDAFLSGTPSEDVTTGRKAPGPRPHLNFVFADARETWWGMGRRLFASERLFADVISECDRHLREAGVGRSLVAQMNLDETHADEPGDAASALTCVILQIALARLWQSWGVKPDAIVGAGLGEVAAAHIAGVLTLRDALSATLIRAGIPTDTFQPGPIPGKPTIPIYLSSAGRLLAAEDLTNDYWKHAAENGTPYSQGLYPLLEEQTGDFLQMGPGVSEAIVQDPQKCKLNGRVLSSWQRYENEPSTMIKTLSALYARGHDIDWNKVYQFGAFVRLPGYPWQHQDYWISQAPPISRVGAKVPAGALSAPIELAEPAGRHMWTGQIRSQDLIALNCAPFDGTILVPVGVFIERALWAARDLFENAACAVAQVDFPEPLFLTCEGSALLQIYMSRMGPQEADFEIYCRIDREFGRWARHAKGRVRVKTKLPNATASDIKCSSGPDRSPAGRTV